MLTWAPFKCCPTTVLAIMDVPYGLNRLKDPLQPHWDDEPTHMMRQLPSLISQLERRSMALA